MEKLISIIVPVYNVEAYLDECLQSIINQTYKNFEIILIDDGSSDNSPTICDQWAARDARFRVIHQLNSGVSVSRNRGLEAATGDYIYFVDSDDFIEASLCKQMVALLESADADIAAFGYADINSSGKIVSKNYGKSASMNQEEAITALCSGEMQSYLWDKIYKRELWKDIRFPADKTFEDIGIMHRVFMRAQRFICVPDIFYYYRRRKNSIVATMSSYSLRDLFFMRKQRYEDVMEVYPQVAPLCFKNVALSAKSYMDRSMWDNPDPQALEAALDFLQENKEEIKKIKNIEINFYYCFPRAYRSYRLLKHKIGNIEKKIRRK